MNYLKSFSPWIAYWTGAAIADWRLGLAAGLLVGLVVVASERHHGVDLISAAGVMFFVLLLPVALVAPANAVHTYTAPLAVGFLGLTAVASIIAGHPFTETYARREVPSELWDTEPFRQANRVITAAWAVAFLTSAAVLVALTLAAPDASGLRLAVQAAGFVAPIGFTSWYRDRIRARYAAPASPVPPFSTAS
jgi:hypothetical protein